ncbi:MAG: class I SAM-dependent methyltransferase [Dehalococcoidia bacterium]
MPDWTWDETLFAGSAKYYDFGRLPYAPGLAEALAESLNLDGTGRLLDLGCGPGTIALKVAHFFEEVVGLDADRDMLAQAERLAAERGVANARWVHLRAEDLPGNLGTFRVITFAQSFHWMVRDQVAAAMLAMLEPGGAAVHVDSRAQNGVAPPPDAQFPGQPEAAIAELVRAYLGPERRAGQGIRNASPGDEDEVLRWAGFVGPDVVVVPDGRLLERSVDEVVAERFSSSGSAPHLFRDRMPQFEADLRRLLLAESPAGRFCVQLPDNQLKIWRPTLS